MDERNNSCLTDKVAALERDMRRAQLTLNALVRQRDGLANALAQCEAERDQIREELAQAHEVINRLTKAQCDDPMLNGADESSDIRPSSLAEQGHA